MNDRDDHRHDDRGAVEMLAPVIIATERTFVALRAS